MGEGEASDSLMITMKSSLVLLLFFFATSLAAQDSAARLIVRVDDMGYSHSGNEAILQTFSKGVASSVEVIVPSPWFPEAAKMLNDHPEIDVGIHLALTSEWDNVKWRPVSHCPSLCDEDGYFFPMVSPNRNYPGRALKENQWNLDEVERELRAQIELGLKKISRISHVSAHMGFTGLDPRVQELVRKLAREYKIDIDPREHGVKSVSYLGPRRTSAEKLESFLKMLETLERGNTYLFVDHPGIDTAELRAIHHIGYEHVAEDRQGVTDTLTHPRVREAIHARGIQLIGYRDLKQSARATQ